jgi:hypothetical protein
MIQVDNVNRTFENQQLLLNLIVHAVDIGAPGKCFLICDKWRQRVYDEFFQQGDLEKERGLPVSILCDRYTTDPYKSQIGFTAFVVQPTFDALLHFIPEISHFLENININLKKYQSLVKEGEKK